MNNPIINKTNVVNSGNLLRKINKILLDRWADPPEHVKVWFSTVYFHYEKNHGVRTFYLHPNDHAAYTKTVEQFWYMFARNVVLSDFTEKELVPYIAAAGSKIVERMLNARPTELTGKRLESVKSFYKPGSLYEEVAVTDSTISTIIDFLQNNPDERIERTSVPDMLRKHNAWVERLNNELIELHDLSLPVVHTFSHKDVAYKVVLLVTEDAFKYEGQRMKNCIKSYYRNFQRRELVIYSIREEDTNKPIVTIEVTQPRKRRPFLQRGRFPGTSLSTQYTVTQFTVISQALGFANAKLDAVWCGIVRDFANKFNFTFSRTLFEFHRGDDIVEDDNDEEEGEGDWDNDLDDGFYEDDESYWNDDDEPDEDELDDEDEPDDEEEYFDDEEEDEPEVKAVPRRREFANIVNEENEEDEEPFIDYDEEGSYDDDEEGDYEEDWEDEDEEDANIEDTCVEAFSSFQTNLGFTKSGEVNLDNVVKFSSSYEGDEFLDNDV